MAPSAPGDFREGRDLMTFVTSFTVNGSALASQSGSMSSSSSCHGGGGGAVGEKSNVFEHLFLKWFSISTMLIGHDWECKWRPPGKNDLSPFLKKMSYGVFRIVIGEFNLNILVKTASRYSNSKFFFEFWSNPSCILFLFVFDNQNEKKQKCLKWAWNHTNLLKIL